MRLESVDEIKAHGVMVYPHVAQWAAEMAAKPRTDEHIADAVSMLAWQLGQLSADDICTLARQLAQADTTKANMLAEALWSAAMDVEHAALQADDAVMDSSNHRAVWGDDMTVVAGTTDDDDMAQLRVAQ